MKTHYFILIFCISISCFSQKIYEQSAVQMLWGEEVMSHHKDKNVQIIGKDSAYYLLVDGEIEKYNQSFELLKSEKIDLMYKKYTQEFEHIEYTDDYLYLFTSYVNRKLKKKFLFVQQIDKNTLKSVKKLQKIAEIPIDYLTNHPNFYFKSSETTQLIYCINSIYQQSELSVFVYNEQFEFLWKKENIEIEKSHFFKIEDVFIDEEANVHLIGILSKQKFLKKQKAKVYQNYSYQLLSFFEQGNTLKKEEISFENKFITNIKMNLNVNNNLLLIGFYLTNKGKQGTFYVKLNKNSHQFVLTKFHKLDQKVFEEGIYEELLTYGHPVIFDYIFKNIHVQKNGEVTLLTEQHYILEETKQKSPTKALFFYHYHYNNLLLFHYNIEGELIWKQHIPKHQFSHNDQGYFLSIASLLSNNKLLIVYNDHHKKHSFATLFPKSTITFIKVNLNNGHYQKDFFQEIKKLDVFLIPKKHKLFDDELLMLGKKGKHHRLVKIQMQSSQ